MGEEKREPSIYMIASGRQACTAGYAFGPAVRGHYILHYISAGSGSYETDGRIFHLKAGQGFIIYPDSRVYYKADNREPWTYQWVDFGGRDADHLMTRCGFLKGRDYIFTDGDLEGNQEVLEQIHKSLLKEGAPEDQLASLGWFYLFLSRIVRPPEQKSYSQVVRQFIQYNYAYPITVQDMADRVGLNRSYLCKIFKQDTGTAPQEYLLKFRLQQAKRLLRETTLPIAEVAYSSGFKEFSHFSTQFKRRVGLSPGQFRAREKK